MAVVNFPQKLISSEARKKFGIPNQYAQLVYGDARYGEKNDYAGIYQIRAPHKVGSGLYMPRRKTRVVVRMKFYVPLETAKRIANPRRAVFAAAVAAWHSLTASQKEFFRLKSFGKHMSGYNVFMHEYLISN